MARFVFTNAYFNFNSVALSNYVSDITLNWTQPTQEVTAMGDQGVAKLPGLRNDSIDVTLRQDYAAALVDATFSAAFLAGTGVPVEIRSDAGTVGTSNPKWTGTVLVESYTPIGGAIGDTADATVTLTVQGALTYATA